jgi:TPR repeat protein
MRLWPRRAGKVKLQRTEDRYRIKMTIVRRTGRILPAILAIGLLAGCAAGSAARLEPPPAPTETDQEVARKAFREAMSLAREGRIEAAAPYYRQAAEYDHPEAQYVLATMYKTGRGLPHDPTLAAEWYGRAAEAGYPLAQFTMGNLLMKGEGVPRNVPMAVKLYRQAAEQDHPQAQYNLGVYYYGVGTAANYQKAEHWFTRAAGQREPSSQYALGRMYASPHDGIRLDRVRAHAWFTLAATNGHTGALEESRELEATLSTAERASARSLARRLAAESGQ